MYTTYPQPQNYGPQHTGYGYAPMPHQPMPMQAPMAAPASSSTNSGLLMIAGLAVVGAAAFGGVYLMNSSEAAPTAASTPSTVFNIPSEINIPSLTTEQQDDPASPVIVNNPAPSVRVFTPSAPRTVTAPVQIQAPAQSQTPAQVQTPAQGQTPANPTKPADEKKDEPKKEEPAPAPAPPPGPDDLIDYGGCACGYPHKPIPSSSPGHLPAWAEARWSAFQRLDGLRPQL